MSALRQIGAVTGLAAEAECLRKAGRTSEPPIIFVSGASAARARDGAVLLAENGAAGLLSFGLAGGLDPGLRAGTLILARAAMAEDGTVYAADKDWRARLKAEIGDRLVVAEGTLAGRDRPVLSAQDKQALFRALGAAAVDMESHAVAAVARKFSLPFMAVRAIADPAARSVPDFALMALGPDGRIRPEAVPAGLLARPWKIPGLLGLAMETRAAMKSLRRVADFSALVGLPV